MMSNLLKKSKIIFLFLSLTIFSVMVGGQDLSGADVLDIFHNDIEIFDYYELVERDEAYYFIFNTSLVEGPFLFSVTDIGGTNLCSIPDINEGVARCILDHYVLTGTHDPAEEVPINYTVRFRAEQVASSGVAVFRDITFTLIPVNNQAYFTQEIENQSINAFAPWSRQIIAFDEEADHPLNFQFTAEKLDNETGNIGLTFRNITDTSAVLTFNEGEPTNADVGNWLIRVTVSDNGGSELPIDVFEFNFEIILFNNLPRFTTNFSNISGVQGEPFQLFLEAQDLDEEDNLTFMALIPEASVAGNCNQEYFLWNDALNLSTLISGPVNASIMMQIPELKAEHVICRNFNLRVQDNTLASQTIPVFFNITNVNDAPVINELSFFETNVQNQENMSNLSVFLYSNNANYRVNATDIDQLTYDAQNTGVLTFSTNKDDFVIDAQTGMLYLNFTNDSMIGVHEVEITVTDNGVPPLNDTKTLIVEIIQNYPPELELYQNKLLFNQSEDIILYFNTTEIDGDNITLIFNSHNLRFDNSIYDSAITINSTYQENETSPLITTWMLNLSKWVEEKLANHTIDEIPSSSLYRKQLVGNHNLTIYVYDEVGAHDPIISRKNVDFTVIRENDAPFFDSKPRNNISDDPTDPTVNYFGKPREGKPVVNIFKITDFDFLLPVDIYQEEITVGIVEYSEGINIYSFILQENQIDAILTFVPLEKGAHFITLNVSDKDGVETQMRIDFLVYGASAPVEILEVSPYFQQGQTITGEYLDVTSVSQPLTVAWQENRTLTFDAKVKFDELVFANATEGDDNYLDINWYVNGELKRTYHNMSNASDFSYQHYFDFHSSGINNITIEATDSVGSSANWTWAVDVENSNRPPIYCPENLNDIIFGGSSITLTHYFSGQLYQAFYDPDDDLNNKGPGSLNPCQENFTIVRNLESLTFDYEIVRGHCEADFIISGTNITVIGKRKSLCEVRFWGTDEFNATINSSEDLVWVEILETISDGIQERERPVTERINVPIREEVDIPKPLKIIFAEGSVIYYNQTIEVPIKIKNSWSEDFKDIQLSASFLNSSSAQQENNMSVSFSTNKINMVPTGGEVVVNLIVSSYRTQEPLLINVYAEVGMPRFTDADTIIISGLESSMDDPQSVKSLVTYARDLLSTSPQCAELNDLLNAAHSAIDSGHADDALRLIDGAINGCKYLLSQDEILRREQPGTLKIGLDFTSENWSEIVYGSIALIFIAIVFYVFSFVRISLKNN